MRNTLKITALLTAALILLCGCASEPAATDGGDTTHPYVTAPDNETLPRIEPYESGKVTDGADTAADTTDGTTSVPPATQPVTDTDRVTDTEPVTTKEEHNVPADGSSVSFLFCGDNLVHDAVINNAKAYAAGTGKTYDFLPIYDAVAGYIRSADIAVINQESQIAGDAGKIGGYPRFNTPEQMGDDLISLGFDVVSTANNHMLDNGTKGLKNSINYWKNKPVLTVGGYESKADYEKIRVLEKNGIKFAFLAYTEMTNSDRRADDGYVTPLLDESVVKRQIAAAKEVADVVIVLPHWGREDDFSVTSKQKKYAALFAECNADIVIGMHSHVAGKIEYLKRKDGGQMLCAYSLGNFVSTMEYARNLVGLMLSLDVVRENGSFVCKNVKAIPTVTYFTYTASKRLEDRDNLRLYLLSDFTDELAAKHAYNEHDKETIRLNRLKKYVTDVVDSRFLPDYLK